MTVKEQCLKLAGKVLAEGLAEALAMEPRTAAERAFVAGATPSVEDLEARIRFMQRDRIAA